MYNTDLRDVIICRLSPVLGTCENPKDSRLLQTYATLCEIKGRGCNAYEKA